MRRDRQSSTSQRARHSAPQPPAPLRILIADDHAVVRRGVKDILADEFGAITVGEARNTAEALELALKGRWDLALLDIAMPGRSGLELLADLKMHRPKLPVLILSVSAEELYAARVLAAGGAGFLSKRAVSDEPIAAVRKVLAGGRYVSPAIAAKLVEDFGKDASQPRHEALSVRELEVLKLIAAGKSVKQIVGELSLSDKTVFTYRERIREKLGVKSDVELARYALEHRLSE
jgi:DNA-binding NarL/FixJ family response regulator